MTPEQVNVFLTRVALLDPRFGYVDVETQVARAEEWAAVLADVEPMAAIEAARAHYRATRDRLMPADVLARCRTQVAPTREELQAKAEWLARHGLTEAQFAAMPRHEIERIVRGVE